MSGSGSFTDWLTPLYGAVAGVAPTWLILIVWGSVCGCLTMGLYGLVSPQRRLSDIDDQLAAVISAAREATVYADVVSASTKRVRLALARLIFVLLPALLAAAPVIVSTLWLESHLSVVEPAPGTAVKVDFEPVHDRLQWRVSQRDSTLHSGSTIAWPQPGQQGLITDREGELQVPVPFASGYRFVTRHWWSALLPGVAGYINGDANVAEIRFDLPPTDVTASRMAFLRRWYIWFFVPLGVAALSLKVIFRIR